MPFLAPVWAWLAPRLVPVILGTALVAGLVGGFFLLRSAWRAEGAATVRADDLQVRLDQERAAAKASADALAKREADFQKAAAAAAEAKKAIEDAPDTSTCGPAVQRALDWLRRAPAGAGSTDP
jgi:hypothetical protein